MNVYFEIAALLMFFSILSSKKANFQLDDRKIEVLNSRFITSVGWIGTTVVLLYFTVFRDAVGSDYAAYRDVVFPSIEYGKFTKSYELIFTLVVQKSAEIFNNDYYFIFAVLGFLVMVPLILGIKSLTKSPVMSSYLILTTLYFSFSLSGVRQAIAGSIALLAMRFVNNNRILFLLLILVAYGFHKSAVIYFIFVLLSNVTFSKKRLLTVLVLFLMVLPVLRTALVAFSTTTGLFSDYWGGDLDNGSSSSSLYLLAILTAVLLFGYFKFAEYSKKDNWMLVTLIMVLTISVIQTILPTPLRSYMIFAPLMIVAVPNVIEKTLNARYRLLGMVLTVLIFGVVFSVNVFKYNLYGTMPFNLNFDWFNNFLGELYG